MLSPSLKKPQQKEYKEWSLDLGKRTNNWKEVIKEVYRTPEKKKRKNRDHRWQYERRPRESAVADYVLQTARAHSDRSFEIIDIKDYDLPFMGTGEVNQAWNENRWVRRLHLHRTRIQSWHISFLEKCVGQRSRGMVQQSSSNRQLWFSRGYSGRWASSLDFGGTKVATVRTNPAFNLFTDFENFATFTPGEHMTAGMNDMLTELLDWADTFANR